MKKAVAVVMVVVMMLALGATAFAENGPLTVEQAKQTALNFTGVKAEEATFTKAFRTYDDGCEVYEIEFFANNAEYDMDVDVYTGTITDYNVEYYGGYGVPSYSAPYRYYYDDDPYDYDDRYDYDSYDYDDYFDPYDYDDMYDYDYDGVYFGNGMVVYDD